MESSGLLSRLALVRTDVSEKLSASFIRVARIGELGTTLKMVSPGMLCRVALVRTDVSEELSASIVRVKESVN
jgi:DNA-binding TFAR19-related protein (PDSD5 family)